MRCEQRSKCCTGERYSFQLKNAYFLLFRSGTSSATMCKASCEETCSTLQYSSTVSYPWPAQWFFALAKENIFFWFWQVKRSFQKKIFFGFCFGFAKAKNHCAGQVLPLAVVILLLYIYALGEWRKMSWEGKVREHFAIASTICSATKWNNRNKCAWAVMIGCLGTFYTV